MPCCGWLNKPTGRDCVRRTSEEAKRGAQGHVTLLSARANNRANVAHALMCAGPAGHPDESACGAHECARDIDISSRILRERSLVSELFIS